MCCIVTVSAVVAITAIAFTEEFAEDKLRPRLAPAKRKLDLWTITFRRNGRAFGIMVRRWGSMSEGIDDYIKKNLKIL